MLLSVITVFYYPLEVCDAERSASNERQWDEAPAIHPLAQDRRDREAGRPRGDGLQTGDYLGTGWGG